MTSIWKNAPREVLAVFTNDSSPLFEHNHTEEPVFLPGNMLESARIQKNLPPLVVPAGCLLDFDGELVDILVKDGKAELEPFWPCFHTRLYRWRVGGSEFGIVGGTVGAPFAVLVAEELFALGCKALVTISSAGLIDQSFRTPMFLLIDQALRDEGTSYHYLPPERFSLASLPLVDAVAQRLTDASLLFRRGSSWTTDAPFRETSDLIAARRGEGIIAVEMEAAALLAMGAALKKPIVCLAHITNSMATREDDFEKGGDTGTQQALDICAIALTAALEHEGGILNEGP
jgi:uridine phosphorylase